MIYLSCDYHHGAHPKIMERMNQCNMEPNTGYGEDPHCAHAAQMIKDLCQDQSVAVHFMVGGTQTNTTIIAAALRPHQGVVTAVSGHINNHESGAIESTGHKVIGLPSDDGKLSAAQIHEYYLAHKQNESYEHIVMPKMVYISNPTEFGSIYSKAELEEISRVCHEDGLYLFMDGARLGYGLMSPENDLDLPVITKCCDVFYIGGTKCGALFGEAVVITNPSLKEDFRFILKQRGGMLAKGWLLGIQFETLFEDGLYFEICKHAVDQAMRIKKAFESKGVAFQVDSPTNQQFAMLTADVIRKFDEKYATCDDEKPTGKAVRSVRFCTSWATDPAEVDELIKDIEAWC